MPSGTKIVALAVGATILTLLLSSSMINSSKPLDVRHSIQVLDDVASATMGLRSYMSSEAPAAVEAAGPEPVQIVQAVESEAHGADASPPPAPAPLTRFSDADYDGYFLYARPEALAAHDAQYLRQLLKSLLGMAVLLKRTLVLPSALCNCRDANLTECDGPRAPPPFDCPLREALDVPKWQASSLVSVRPARFLLPTGGGVLPDVADSFGASGFIEVICNL